MATPLTEHRIWTDLAFENRNERLTIDFEIVFQITPSGRKQVYEVKPVVTLNASPNQEYFAPNLIFNHRTPIFFQFRTGYILEGWLEWQDRLVTQERFQVISRISLQSPVTHETWNYEGFMVQFGEHEPAPPPVPPIPPAPPWPEPVPQPAADVAVQQVDLNTQELFPFIYLQPWPQISDAERKAAFIDIPDAVTQNNDFWTDLKSARNKSHTATMRTDAVGFIDGTSYTGEYVESIVSLSPPYLYFLPIYGKLKARPRPTFEDLNGLVEEYFGTWDDLKTALSSKDAQTELQNIWNTVLALLVMLGARHTLLAELIKVLTANHVLELALPYAEELPKSPKGGGKTGGGKKGEESEESEEGGEEAGADADLPKENTEGADGGETGSGTAPEPLPLLPSAEQIRVWLNATLVSPADIFPLPGPKRTPRGAATNGWVRPYSIGRVSSVHYQPAGYSLGEVQRIENILRGEVRERSNRHLTRAETSQDRGTERTSKDGRDEDVASTDLIKQIQKTLSDKLSTTGIDSYDAKYGMPSDNDVTISGKWWVQDQPAGGYLQDASRFARDIVEKTLRRIEQRVHDQRTTRRIEEQETRDVSRFENLAGAEDIRGIYRWVNRSYRVISRDLGDRLVMEIILDDPAEFLLENLQRYTSLTLKPPLTPAEFGITGYQNMLPDPPAPKSGADPKEPAGNGDTAGDKPDGKYYLDAFQQFGVTEPMPPPLASVTVAQGLKSRNPVCETSLSVPMGYAPALAWAQVAGFSDDVTTSVYVGTTKLTISSGGGDGQTVVAGDLPSGTAIPSEDGTHRLWVAVICKPKTTTKTKGQAQDEATGLAATNSGNGGGGGTDPAPAPDDSPAEGSEEFTTYFVANIEVECDRSQELLADWQYRAYQAVMAGYQAQLDAFRAQLETQRDAISNENPDFLQTTINNQIIQGCLAELYAGYLRQTDLGDGTPEVPSQVSIGEPRIFQFLRNALAWGDLDCQIYLSGDDRHDKWLREGENALLEVLSPDLQFRNFLRAKRARILVTAQPWVTRSFLYFLGTGQIWPDDDCLAPCLDSDVEIIAKLKAEEALEGTRARPDSWVIQVPTAMTVLSNELFLPETIVIETS